MDISNANSDRIYQWVKNEPSDSYIRKNFLSGFEESHVLLQNKEVYTNALAAFLFHVFH